MFLDKAVFLTSANANLLVSLSAILVRNVVVEFYYSTQDKFSGEDATSFYPDQYNFESSKHFRGTYIF